MPRISEYTEDVAPAETAYLVASLAGITNKLQAGEIPLLPYRGKMLPQVQEFLATLQNPFTAAAITLGTIAQVASTASHPGVYRITSAAGLNSGAEVTLSGSVLLGGSEVVEAIVFIDSTTNLLVYAGFADAAPPTAPTDGAWINITGTTLNGKTANNTATSTTGTSLTVAASTWYRLKVALNASATLVTFTVYDMSGTVLWTDTLSTNIPTTAARLTQFRVAAIKTAVTLTAMLDIDWIAFWCNDPQVR